MIEALLSSVSEDYGTPSPYVELARYVLERLDLDPASSSYWNQHVVKARSFYDERIDALKQSWFGNVIHNAPSNRALKITVRPFWERLVEHYIRGEVDCAIWIGFQLGQLQALQGTLAHPLQFFNLFPANRIDFMRRGSSVAAEALLKSEHPGADIAKLDKLRERQIADRINRACVDCGGFVQPGATHCAPCFSTPPRAAGSPTHANYITLLPTKRSPAAARAMVSRFIERAADLTIGGALVRPV